MFHLITHAFFKALLFLGSGSVIHGCHEEQDIRKMGGLKKYMPLTFATYAIGMLALAGFPLFFSGFWSKDAILHCAQHWSVSQVPFYLGSLGVLFTAFYMTRQVALVFFGQRRTGVAPVSDSETAQAEQARTGGRQNVHISSQGSHNESLRQAGSLSYEPHESPAVMTVPLVILAGFAILLGLVGTPAWPWFDGFLNGEKTVFHFNQLTGGGTLELMMASSAIVFTGLILGWFCYGRRSRKTAEEKDILEIAQPAIFKLLQNKYYVDEFYEATVIRFNAFAARFCNFLDRWIFGGAVVIVSCLTLGIAWLYRLMDEYLVNLGFDAGCQSIRLGGRGLSRMHTGRVQTYLRIIGVALVGLILFLIWGRKA
jgi:NADH-quinone oxidoreductase subunit L